MKVADFVNIVKQMEDAKIGAKEAVTGSVGYGI